MITAQELKHVVEGPDLIGKYVPLKRSGSRWIAKCPFHDDDSPSLCVYPGEKGYYCFGCGCGGDIFNFVESIEGCSFPEALERVAQHAGINLRHGPPSQPTLEWKLAPVEQRGFDWWLWRKRQRLQSLRRLTTDQIDAILHALESLWNAEVPEDEVHRLHNSLTSLRQERAVIDKELESLDLDPASHIERFLRGFYSGQDEFAALREAS